MAYKVIESNPLHYAGIQNKLYMCVTGFLLRLGSSSPSCVMNKASNGAGNKLLFKQNEGFSTTSMASISFNNRGKLDHSSWGCLTSKVSNNEGPNQTSPCPLVCKMGYVVSHTVTWSLDYVPIPPLIGCSAHRPLGVLPSSRDHPSQGL